MGVQLEAHEAGSGAALEPRSIDASLFEALVEKVAREMCHDLGKDPDRRLDDPCGGFLSLWHLYTTPARQALNARFKAASPERTSSCAATTSPDTQDAK